MSKEGVQSSYMHEAYVKYIQRLTLIATEKINKEVITQLISGTRQSAKKKLNTLLSGSYIEAVNLGKAYANHITEGVTSDELPKAGINIPSPSTVYAHYLILMLDDIKETKSRIIATQKLANAFDTTAGIRDVERERFILQKNIESKIPAMILRVAATSYQGGVYA